MHYDKAYWDKCYKDNNTAWDLGEISNPLKEYFNQLNLVDSDRVLIVGGGNSYEAEYLFNLGMKNIFIVDISLTALNNFSKRVSKFPNDNLINMDVFELEGTFDLIIEQTFFCAIHPKLRLPYLIKINKLLRPSGKFIGLLFSTPLNSNKPPYGGNKNEYMKMFSSVFKVDIMAKCYNSSISRKGRELFFKCTNK